MSTTEENQMYYYLVAGQVLAEIDGSRGQVTLSTVTAIPKDTISKLDYANFHKILEDKFYAVMLEDVSEENNPVIAVIKVDVLNISPMGKQTSEDFNKSYEELQSKLSAPIDSGTIQ